MNKKTEELFKFNEKGQWSIETLEKGSLGDAITAGIKGSGSTPQGGINSAISGMNKDDAPHEAGSPEDSAHDVAEEDSSLEDELKDLHPEDRPLLLGHLRTLKDKRKHRSEQNKKIGKE